MFCGRRAEKPVIEIALLRHRPSDRRAPLDLAQPAGRRAGDARRGGARANGDARRSAASRRARRPARGHRRLEASLKRRHPEYARSEEHTSELQSLMRISYAVFCLKKKIQTTKIIH